MITVSNGRNHDIPVGGYTPTDVEHHVSRLAMGTRPDRARPVRTTPGDLFAGWDVELVFPVGRILMDGQRLLLPVDVSLIGLGGAAVQMIRFAFMLSSEADAAAVRMMAARHPRTVRLLDHVGADGVWRDVVARCAMGSAVDKTILTRVDKLTAALGGPRLDSLVEITRNDATPFLRTPHFETCRDPRRVVMTALHVSSGVDESRIGMAIRLCRALPTISPTELASVVDHMVLADRWNMSDRMSDVIVKAAGEGVGLRAVVEASAVWRDTLAFTHTALEVSADARQTYAHDTGDEKLYRAMRAADDTVDTLLDLLPEPWDEETWRLIRERDTWEPDLA